MYETIVVPVDGSAPADAALDRAIALSAAFDAALHLLYVVDTRSLSTAGMDTDALLDAYEREGERLVSEAADRIRDRAPEVAIERAVEAGAPYEVIVEYAGTHGADLVVMGTHGRTGLSHALLGSVTERVLRTSPVPVMTVREAADVV